MVTAVHLSRADEAKCREEAAEILRLYGNNDLEYRISNAISRFLLATRLVKTDELVDQVHPSDTSRRLVDLTALDTFIEVKRRIGTAGRGEPNPEYVEQLDGYLAESHEKDGRVRLGILTDGKYWLLRWTNAGPVNTAKPYGFTLEFPGQWMLLYEWLRDQALETRENRPVDRDEIKNYFGPGSPNYGKEIDALKTLYQANAARETIQVKRRLWQDLLRTALGEMSSSPEQMDDLFVRHTYLSAVIGMVVQASFRFDLRQLAAIEPEDLLYGRRFRSATGLQGIVESNFFAWPAEVGGRPFLEALARRIANFNWLEAPADIGAILYENIIPANEREQLGEYYTPAWLAQAMVEEVVTDPVNQRVLDPACGSGTFLVAAVNHFSNAVMPAGKTPRLEPRDALNKLRENVTGIDIHPVAVHLARAAWILAARPVLVAAAGSYTRLSIPVYLGDSLQLRYRTGDFFAEREITIQTQEAGNTELVFPVSLVDRAEDFDRLMGDVANDIEQGFEPFLALDDNDVTDAEERETLQATIAKIQELHKQGRNHIWAYYTRNMVRPVALARRKVDVIIGNPPWLNYNRTAGVLREELQNLSKERYGIWDGGGYASNQDVAGLFFARSVDLYLKDGGVIGFVMPHSALQSGQFEKWRTGRWASQPAGRGRNRASAFIRSVAFDYKPAWDLAELRPNNFFSMAACAVFARSTGKSGIAVPLTGEIEVWQGVTGSNDVRRVARAVADTSAGKLSPYDYLAAQGASIRPRRFFFVQETENPAFIRAGNTITVNPRRGVYDQSPWKDLDLTDISNQTIEKSHLFDIHLGETVAPYVALSPLRALLPLKQGEYAFAASDADAGGVDPGSLEQRMRQRWQTISQWWSDNRTKNSPPTLLGRLDYEKELSSQLNWQFSPDDRPLRVVYSTSGEPTAALLPDDAALVDERLYWIPCKDADEANYLLAIINSDALYERVRPLMSKGQYGARDLHKKLWYLPIPAFDARQKLHMVIAKTGERAAAGAAAKLAEVRAQRGDAVGVTIIRRELRQWLRSSPEGKEVEAAVAALLGRGVDYRGTITIEEGKRFGKPCIRGIRMTAQDVMEYLAGGETWAGMLYHFPNLTEQDMYVCLSFAAAEQMDDDYSHLRYAVV